MTDKYSSQLSRILCLEYTNCLSRRDIKSPPPPNSCVMGMTINFFQWWGLSFGALRSVRSTSLSLLLSLWLKVIVPVTVPSMGQIEILSWVLVPSIGQIKIVSWVRVQSIGQIKIVSWVLVLSMSQIEIVLWVRVQSIAQIEIVSWFRIPSIGQIEIVSWVLFPSMS